MEHIFCSMNINFLNISPDFSWGNVTAAKGLQLTMVGMITVFIGLIVIWGMVVLNRKVISGFEKISRKGEEVNTPDKSLSPIAMVADTDNEELAAIIAVTCAYCEEFEDDHMEILRLQNIEHEVSPWVVLAREQMMRKN